MLGQKRILIVDDYADHRFLLTYQLQKMGNFVILEAANGQDALDLVSQEPLDLIFMNLNLPVVDGWEAVRRIRIMSSPARDVPIIAFTAYALASAEQKALAAGCDDYIVKPVVDFALLQQKVTRFLTKGRTP